MGSLLSLIPKFKISLVFPLSSLTR